MAVIGQHDQMLELAETRQVHHRLPKRKNGAMRSFRMTLSGPALHWQAWSHGTRPTLSHLPLLVLLADYHHPDTSNK